MQIFQKAVKKANASVLVYIYNCTYGIHDDEDLISGDRNWKLCIKNRLRFNSLNNFTSLFSLDKVTVEFIKRTSFLVLFVGYIPTPWKPFDHLAGMNALAREVRVHLGSNELYECKMILNSGERIDVEKMRHLDVLDIYYKDTYPSPALARMAEFMNRVMGVDLPDLEFPNYSFEELLKIAAHINRENFNFGEPRADAIPKYFMGPNGRPEILG